MRSRLLLLAVILVVVPTLPARAQLKDDMFKIPTKPEAFTEKTLLAVPSPEVGKDKPPPPLWCGGVEFGLNGSDGNSDVFNLRVGANAKRQTADNLFTTDLLYNYARQNSVVSANKALYNIRDEFLFRDTPWALFLSGQLEYDQFRAFDLRLASHAGFAYQLVKSDDLSLRTRLGAGVMEEIGNPTSKCVPEGLLGFDLCYKLNDRQRIVASGDYYPDLSQPQYRVRTRAAYEILLDPAWGLVLRLGVQDRYDSHPGTNTKRNDLDYFTTLLLKF